MNTFDIPVIQINVIFLISGSDIVQWMIKNLDIEDPGKQADQCRFKVPHYFNITAELEMDSHMSCANLPMDCPSSQRKLALVPDCHKHRLETRTVFKFTFLELYKDQIIDYEEMLINHGKA